MRSKKIVDPRRNIRTHERSGWRGGDKKRRKKEWRQQYDSNGGGKKGKSRRGGEYKYVIRGRDKETKGGIRKEQERKGRRKESNS